MGRPRLAAYRRGVARTKRVLCFHAQASGWKNETLGGHRRKSDQKYVGITRYTVSHNGNDEVVYIRAVFDWRRVGR